jgi:hypothetical protein
MLSVSSTVDHPPHYGGAKNLYEAIKVIEAWGLNFHLGNSVKYVARAGRKGDAIEDLEKAQWYLAREIARRRRAQQVLDRIDASLARKAKTNPANKKASRK